MHRFFTRVACVALGLCFSASLAEAANLNKDEQCQKAHDTLRETDNKNRHEIVLRIFKWDVLRINLLIDGIEEEVRKVKPPVADVDTEVAGRALKVVSLMVEAMCPPPENQTSAADCVKARLAVTDNRVKLSNKGTHILLTLGVDISRVKNLKKQIRSRINPADPSSVPWSVVDQAALEEALDEIEARCPSK